MDEASIRDRLAGLHAETFGWCLRCCGRDAAEAEDVLQGVYLKIIDGRAAFRGGDHFKTWLFAVVRTTAADHRRRRFFARLRLSRFAARARAPEPEPEPGDAIDDRYHRERLAEGVALLPRRQQEAIHLVFYHDLSLSQAATVMGVSIGSARTHYHRAKERLRRWAVDKDVFHDWR